MGEGGVMPWTVSCLNLLTDCILHDRPVQRDRVAHGPMTVSFFVHDAFWHREISFYEIHLIALDWKQIHSFFIYGSQMLFLFSFFNVLVCVCVYRIDGIARRRSINSLVCLYINSNNLQSHLSPGSWCNVDRLSLVIYLLIFLLLLTFCYWYFPFRSVGRCLAVLRFVDIIGLFKMHLNCFLDRTEMKHVSALRVDCFRFRNDDCQSKLLFTRTCTWIGFWITADWLALVTFEWLVWRFSFSPAKILDYPSNRISFDRLESIHSKASSSHDESTT